MAIFPNLKLEDIVQINDKTRLDASKSFTADEAAVTLVEIEPESAAGFIDITPTVATNSKQYFLDWSYSGTSRTVTVSVRITTDGAPVTFTETMEVVTEADDALFSDDKDLEALENDIIDYVPAGRNSFLNYHRKAQTLILDYLNEQGHETSSGVAIQKDAVVDVNEVRKWSESLTLALIFEDLSNSVNDRFEAKRLFYMSRVSDAKKRSILRLDLDGSGGISDGEGIPFKTMDLLRR